MTSRRETERRIRRKRDESHVREKKRVKHVWQVNEESRGRKRQGEGFMTDYERDEITDKTREGRKSCATYPSISSKQEGTLTA